MYAQLAFYRLFSCAYTVCEIPVHTGILCVHGCKLNACVNLTGENSPVFWRTDFVLKAPRLHLSGGYDKGVLATEH